MIAKDAMRRFEVKQADGSWVTVDMGQLEEGDVIRMTEPDGKVHFKDGNVDGRTELVVISHPAVRVATLDEEEARVVLKAKALGVPTELLRPIKVEENGPMTYFIRVLIAMVIIMAVGLIGYTGFSLYQANQKLQGVIHNEKPAVH